MKLRVVDNEEVMEKIEAVKNFNCMKGKKCMKGNTLCTGNRYCISAITTLSQCWGRNQEVVIPSILIEIYNKCANPSYYTNK